MHRISSGRVQKIIKRLQRRKYDSVIIERTIGCTWLFHSLVQICPEVLH